jgi:hypothetical protein
MTPFRQFLQSGRVVDAEEALTNQPDIRAWLVDAVYAAGMRSGQEPDGFGREHDILLQELERQFPGEVAEVLEQTNGCGHIDIDWHPVTPEYAALFINFGRGLRAQRLECLEDTHVVACTEALERLRAELPPTEPFPGHPHIRTAVIVTGNTCLGVRVTLRTEEDAPLYTLLTGQKEHQDLRLPVAASKIEDLLGGGSPQRE